MSDFLFDSLLVHNLNKTNKIWFSYLFQLKINPKNWQSWENNVQIKTAHINKMSK
jgi:hypothetical protein